MLGMSIEHLKFEALTFFVLLLGLGEPWGYLKVLESNKMLLRCNRRQFNNSRAV